MQDFVDDTSNLRFKKRLCLEVKHACVESAVSGHKNVTH